MVSNMIIFHEIYGLYYRVVAEVLGDYIRNGSTSFQHARNMIGCMAHTECQNAVLDGLFGPNDNGRGYYRLFDREKHSHIVNEPSMPFTLIEKRWIRTILDDPRIRLFDIPMDGFDDVEPIWRPGDIQIVDAAADGDPYDNENYISTFRRLFQAYKTQQCLELTWQTRMKTTCTAVGSVSQFEFSQRDDKFRIELRTSDRLLVVNIGRIIQINDADNCPEIPDIAENASDQPQEKIQTLKLQIHDEYGAFDRAMTEFAMYEKVESRIREDGDLYIVLRYRDVDERELLVRLLGFGTPIRVLGPKSMLKLIHYRLKKQRALMTD